MRLAIFDLDGVITSEEGYWETAREGVVESLSLTAAPSAAIPQDFIFWAKNHAINHNWDLAFLARSVHQSGMSFDQFQHEMRSLWGRELLEACPGYRGDPWRQMHTLCQSLQDRKSPPKHVLYPVERLRAIISEASASGFMLAVATGRPRVEALAPLDAAGITDYFELDRIVTHDDVVRAEATLEEAGRKMPLGKPHPYVVWKAMHPSVTDEALATGDYSPIKGDILFFGDTLSDIRAALRAGVTPVGVLTALPQGSGFYQQRKQALAGAGCEKFLDTLEELPALLS